MNEKLDLSRLDKMMDGALERMESQGPVSADPYHEGPLAADHFLLKKSWDYFRHRVETLELQFQEMLDAKASENAALKKELQNQKEITAALEDKKNMLEAFQDTVSETRSQDYEDFKSKAEKLRLAWEVERMRLHDMSVKLEQEVIMEKKKHEQSQTDFKKKERAYLETIHQLKDKSLLSHEENMKRVAEERKIMQEKEEMIISQENKLDMLRDEINRQQEILKNLNGEVSIRDAKIDAFHKRIEELEDKIKEGQKHNELLQTHNEMLKREKDTMRINWYKEQASWRELWDRARETWEAQKDKDS